jgi:methionine synthase I (cobalamin-dependent)
MDGDISFDLKTLKAFFTEQARSLIEGGVDLILLETFTKPDEIITALDAVKSCQNDMFVITSMTFIRKVIPSMDIMWKKLSNNYPVQVLKRLE